MLTEPVDFLIKQLYLEISKLFEIHFIETGTDDDNVHFLVQSVPTIPPQRIVQIIKSITAREVFRQIPEVKKQLWGGQFWTNGYFVNTVGKTGSENPVRQYVKSQGRAQEYRSVHTAQLTIFDQ